MTTTSATVATPTNHVGLPDCPLCVEPIKASSRVVLSCGHSVCEQCVEHSKQSCNGVNGGPMLENKSNRVRCPRCSTLATALPAEPIPPAPSVPTPSTLTAVNRAPSSTLFTTNRPQGVCDLLLNMERAHSTRIESVRYELLNANKLLATRNQQLTAQLHEIANRERHLFDALKTAESKRERMDSFHSTNTRELISDFERRMSDMKAKLEAVEQRTRIKEEAMSKALDAKEARIKQLEETQNVSASANKSLDDSDSSTRLQLARERIEKEVRNDERQRRKRAQEEEKQHHADEIKRLREKHERKEESLMAEWRAKLERVEARERERKEKELSLPRCADCAKRTPEDEFYTCLDEGCLIERRAPSACGEKWAIRNYCMSCTLDSHRTHSSVPLSRLASSDDVKAAQARVEQIREEVNSSLIEPYSAYKELLLNEAIADRNSAIGDSAACLYDGKPMLRTTLEEVINKAQAIRNDFAKFLDEEFAQMIDLLKERIRLDQGSSFFSAGSAPNI